MFIDKEKVLKNYFEPSDSSKLSKELSNRRKGLIKRFIYDKDQFYILLSQYGVEIKFLSDEELADLMDEEGNLPDNIDGEVVLFFNTEDAARILNIN